MKKITSVICLFFLSCYGYSQVYFNSLPEDKQLVGRDISTNKGLIKISGDVNTITEDTAEAEAEKLLKEIDGL